jgi:malate-CoA ligase subunit alpha
MSILLDEKTPVLVQGFTGTIGGFHAKEMLDYGTNVVGGVTPGKGGTAHLGKPVFNSLKVAVAETAAVASIVFVPPPFAADAIMEAADAGIRLCVCITDGIPAQDMIRVKRYLRRYKRHRRMRLIGPNCAGVISPGKAMMGITGSVSSAARAPWAMRRPPRCRPWGSASPPRSASVAIR